MNDVIQLTETISPETKFEFWSGENELIKASEVSGKKMLHGIASSTTRDLHGDVINRSALEDMERTAVGMTIFLNHSYELPGDVGGTVTKAIIKQRGVDQEGDPNWQLEFDIEVEDENPAAVQTWKYIKKGRKLGLSIGAMIPEGGAKRQKDGSYIIEHVILLETSMVGIPANPKSWIDYAASALRGMVEKSQTTDLGSPTLTLDGDEYHIRGSMKDVKFDLSGKPEPEEDPVVGYAFGAEDDGKTTIRRAVVDSTASSTEIMGSWDLSDADDRLLAVATVGEEAVIKATVWVTTRDGDTITIGDPVEESAEADITADADPDQTSTSPEPDVTDAKIRVIEVDTDEQSGDSSQGASSSEPDDADATLAAPEADVSADGEPLILDDLPEDELVKLSFRQLQVTALRAVTELVAAKTALGEEKVARIEAERQRDQVVEAAAELVKRTGAIIEKVGSAPLPRKSILRGIENEFSTSIEDYYGTAFARALAGKK